MARNFDFNKYKAMVDYIQSSTGDITTSIDNLIKGSIELRSSSIASIVKYSTSIKEIVIGRMVSIIGSDIWSTEGAISLDMSNGGVVSFFEDYKYDSDAMLPSAINNKIIENIGEKFVRKSGGTIVLQREYDPLVESFSGQDIPSVSFFKSNYVVIDSGVMYGKIILASDSKNNPKSAVNKIVADKLSGSSKVEKFISSKSTKVLSNFFDVSSDKSVSISSNPNSLVVGVGVSLGDAPTEKSLITSDNIERAVVRKDLANLEPCLMQVSGTSDDNVQTVDDALSSILSYQTIIEDVKTIPRSCQPSYTSSILHPQIEEDTDAIKDKYGVLEMEKYLGQSKSSFRPDPTVSMYTRLFALTPIGYNASVKDVSAARGSTATTIKLVYEMVATRLLLENINLFIDNSEFLGNQIASSLLLQASSSPEFNRRPALLSSVNDAASISDLSLKIIELHTEETGGKVRSW